MVGQAKLRAGAGTPRMGPGPGVARRSETPGAARGPALRLQECHHGCKKHLGDIISFFFRFISGNLARGEGCFDGTGQGSRRKRVWDSGLPCLPGKGQGQSEGTMAPKGRTGRNHLTQSPAPGPQAVRAKPGLPYSWAWGGKGGARGLPSPGAQTRAQPGLGGSRRLRACPPALHTLNPLSRPLLSFLASPEPPPAPPKGCVTSAVRMKESAGSVIALFLNL